MPSHEQKLYHPDDFNKDWCWDTSYGSDGHWSMGYEVKIMEGRITFGCFLVSLFSSSLLWISARYKWRQHGFLPSAYGGGVSTCTGSAKGLALSRTDQLRDLWVRTIVYVEWLFHSLSPFPFVFSARWMQPRRSAPQMRDNVTAILYSRLTARVGSLAIILPMDWFTITWVHVCNRIPIITVCMSMKLIIGVRAVTAVHTSLGNHTNHLLAYCYFAHCDLFSGWL